MSDLISRQVLELWNRYRPTIAVDAIEYDRELKKLLGTNLAEVGKNCISRQTALVAVKDALMAWSYMPEWRDEKILEAIAALPSAEPRTGKWIRDGHHIRCDQCGMYMCDTDREGDRIPAEFCPNCGADMREVTE